MKNGTAIVLGANAGQADLIRYLKERDWNVTAVSGRQVGDPGEKLADSFVKLKRFEGYTPDTRYGDLAGFGGYKVACLNTVTFRMVPEPGARVAGRAP